MEDGLEKGQTWKQRSGRRLQMESQHWLQIPVSLLNSCIVLKSLFVNGN